VPLAELADLAVPWVVRLHQQRYRPGGG
jgi:hypothetical protein